ncbi:hypothetical protein INS49_004299 [Diaporthe citri]|uniref:uncharacterized protein n=1 Tax=Diaporthe citri TaxID=83186 RepID=UPI001C7F0835|nr:uncharacterized protein INS49_004299 [Diaporthe citri]KAG6355218.1 hypothetical protein INS49_004299 [Diaporthe citri]
MNDLIAFLVDTASGVFLWVRLVVHELLRAARDGATFSELVDKAHQLPRDLDSYFTRFIDSIPPEYRKEASQLFQIALHDENSFTALHGLRLLDLSYLGSFQEPFQSRGKHKATAFDPINIAELESRLETTARRINSRCRGLIECYYMPGDAEHFVGFPEISVPGEMGHDALETLPSEDQSFLGLLIACNRHVGFIHRSLRDFLVSPDVLQKLEAYSGGPFNTRLFLCKARLAQIQSLEHEGNHRRTQLALGLSSYVLSALGTENLKYSDECALIAAQLKPVVESLGRAQAHKAASQGWYLSASFHERRPEVPDFLGVAIDFDLVAYLRKELTAEALHAKRGLSVLNCILVGRFSDYLGSDITVGNRIPNIEVLRLALDLGADPNEDCDGISVWAEFILHLDTLATRGAPPAGAQKAHVEAIRALLEHGADPELPSSWLTPGPLIPRWDTDLIPVLAILRSMLGLYTHARLQLQECIDLADDKLLQALLQR